jgi:DMSO reductase family type II enzyme heme b subunit
MTTIHLQNFIPLKPWRGFLKLMGVDAISTPGFPVVSAIAGVLFFLPVSLPAYALPSTPDIPKSITVKGKTVSLKNLKNPLRRDKANLSKNIREGGTVYFKKCFFCHGDHLDGKGIFGNRFFPAPADFTHSNSVTTLPESYAYWRIMKGGQGLPDKFAPWDSSMPAWEDQLTEEEVWKVILFIYNASKKTNPVKNATASKPSLKRGKELHHEKCAYCHGDTGKGDGPSARYSSPQPRNFTKSHIKIRTTVFGKIPTDQDIFDTITLGMPGTTMPGWSHLSESDRWSLVLYLKSLGRKYKRFIKKGKKHAPVVVPNPPASFNLESLATGKKLFLQNCSGCHGVKGRSDGASTHKIVDIDSNAIWPRNLSKPWTFRRGNSRKQLFLTLRTGFSTTSMPRFSTRIFTDQQVWDIVNYVQTLSPPKKPPVKKTIRVKSIAGDVPSTPEDSRWKGMESYFIPLGGQVLEKHKSYFPLVDNVIVKAVHNKDEISIYIHWDDPSVDPILVKTASVEKSPTPPLPPELRGEKNESETKEVDEPPQTPEFPDALAVQFPSSLDKDGKRPYFLNGDSKRPVNLWKWQSHPNKTVEMNATGLSQWTVQPKENQKVVSKSSYRYGRYHLVLKRKLKTKDVKNDIQFKEAVKIPIAINVWDGFQDEEGTKKAISSWFEMKLE